MPIRVLIVEDEPEFQRRFADAVRADEGLALMGAVSFGREALALIEDEAPDVMLVDLGLPDMSGIEVIREASRRWPGVDILVVTMFGDDGHVIDSIGAGATGYLLKDASLRNIAEGIHDLRAGGSPISPSVARRVLQRFRAGPPADSGAASQPPPAPGEPGSPLSERETEILRLVAKGLPFDTVGLTLGISPHTVVTHVKRIYRKLAVHSRGEAVFEAGQMGLL